MPATVVRETSRTHRLRWSALAVLALGLFIASLDNTILNVALPTLARELHASTDQLQWTVDAYQITYAGLLLVDFKLEFGVFHGEIVLGDEFSPDGCRLWDKETRKKMDKDRFRQGLGDVIEAYEEVAQRLGVPL